MLGTGSSVLALSARLLASSGVDLEEALRLPPIEPRQVAVGAGVVLAGFLLARLVRWAVRAWLARRHTASYARVFATLAGFAAAALGVGAGLTVAFPSVRPVDVLGGLGVVSVAVGIAFQNVLSNLFAGLLILVREPFRAGDQIAVDEVRGTVEEVNLRETVVRTFDGRRVLVPNSTVHGEVVTVQTGYDSIRTSVEVGVAYGTDLPRARAVALAAVHDLPGVAEAPAPQCLLCELGASSVVFELRFWSGARQLEALETRDRVIEAVVAAFEREGVEMPPETRLLDASPRLAAALAGRDPQDPQRPAAGRDGRDGRTGPDGGR
ncbi:mechanosensitive ion channel family protein [Quadrisphaera sp. DSM 44207]|uniref:mechanosensitive ion channel family protein n=1 Tax=Quadrisphaera sp. DSM 44207 TaxID=1881057 RepID=UPI00088BD6E5|nr:mechanosensitive ion channel family protein [Quadrisphaera sp. DSM 44207]SDQ63219.1 Mechanosensitive ion channel [Quadrisphaera sp. DSM 44207]